MRKLREFLLNRKGVSTIEFALTIGLFLMVLFMIFEFGRMALLSAYWDLTVSESVRITKNQRAPDGNYEKLFRDTLIKQYNAITPPTVMALFAAETIKVGVDLKYAESVNDLIHEQFREPKIDPKTKQPISPTGKEAAIARYTLNYEYNFLIPLPFLKPIANSLYKREILTVQEYERTVFPY